MVFSTADLDVNISFEERQQVIKLYNQAINYMLINLAKDNANKFIGLSYPVRFVQSLIYKNVNPTFCPALAGTLAVWTNGSTYPCFMFYGEEKYKIGNIMDNDLKNKIREFHEIFSPLKNQEQCGHCWGRNICSGCWGAVYLETGDTKNIPDFHCAWTLGMFEETLLTLAEIRSDNLMWNNFLRNLKGIKQQSIR